MNSSDFDIPSTCYQISFLYLLFKVLCFCKGSFPFLEHGFQNGTCTQNGYRQGVKWDLVYRRTPILGVAVQGKEYLKISHIITCIVSYCRFLFVHRLSSADLLL